MFGLMRSRSCSLGPDEKLRRRLHYCGTCKTIGSRYGQSARLLLNFDSVFAAEVLTAIAGCDTPGSWDRNFHSFNCFRLPNDDVIPEAVRYAAAITVVLAEVKIADQIDDGGTFAWRILRRGMSARFRQASRDLVERWAFPGDELWTHVRRQAAVERSVLDATCAVATSTDPGAVLLACAQATGEATALAFRHAAVAIGRPDAAAPLDALGRSFGHVVYTLDAIRDVAEDSRAGTFNAVSAAFGARGDRLSAETRRAAVRTLRAMQADLETAIERLPIPPDRAAIFVDRLRSNVDRVVGSRRLTVLKSTAERRSPVPRVRGLIGATRRLTEAFALFNVAAIGGALAMAMPPMGPGIDPTGSVRRRPQKGQAGGDSGDSSADCCCDCCDGCCGADSSCGSCNCCGEGHCGSCGDCGDCFHCSNSCCDCDCGNCCDCNCD